MDVLDCLRVRISASPNLQVGDTLDIQVQVENTSNSTITVLTWNNLLDPQAGVLGLFELRDVQDGSVQQGKVLMVNRLMPPSQDSLVGIPARGSVENMARLTMLSLQSTRSYEVVAKGEWKGVWDRPSETIDAKTLENFDGASTGEFTSNKITVEIP